MRIAGPDAVGALLVSRLGAEPDAASPITVEYLVENLLPYHHVRSALGLTMKGEYDLAILHLLHGGDHLRVDAELAEAVERELAAPEPDLGFLSDLAEARVEVRPEAWTQWSGDPAPEPRPEVAPEVESQAETTRSVGDSDEAPFDRVRNQGVVTGGYSAERSRQPADPARGKGDRPATSSERCRHCQRLLPEHSELQFCPYCGVGQADPTCADCNEQLERGWAYCPRCGKATDT